MTSGWSVVRQRPIRFDVIEPRESAQVKIAGKDYFPRFVMRVEPLQRLPGG
jgi:hypothetical protein